jgi:hypothetical protein
MLIGSNGGCGSLGDATHVLAELKAYVSFFAPLWTPAVAHAPVLDVVLYTPARHLNAMTQRFTAVVGNDSSGVRLP